MFPSWNRRIIKIVSHAAQLPKTITPLKPVESFELAEKRQRQ